MLNGPILFLSNSMRAPNTLTDLATFAAAGRRDLKILLKLPKRTAATIVSKRVAMWRESLPADLQYLPIEAIHPHELRPLLHKTAAKSAGLLSLIPSRRGNPSRTFAHNDYEVFLIEGPMPVLALPHTGTLPTITKVLFPADLSPRSEAALDDTIVLCKELGAELHLLHVYGPDTRLPSEMDIAARQAAQSPRELFDLDQEHLRRLSACATEQGVTSIVARAEGRAHSEILRYVQDHGINLLVMATHGPRSSSDIFLGSTTVRTILASNVPVIGVQC